MKKFLSMMSILLVAVMLTVSLGSASVYAEEEAVPLLVKASGVNIIEAEDGSMSNKQYRDYGSNNGAYPNSGCLVLSNVYSHSISIQYYVDVEEAGSYEMKLYIWGAGAKSFRVSVDGVLQLEAAEYTDISICDEINLGSLRLDKGKHYINLNSVYYEGTIYFYYLSLEQKDVITQNKSGSFKSNLIPGMIQAEDFDLGTDGSHGLNDVNVVTNHRKDSKVTLTPKPNETYDLILSDGEWVNYTIEAKVSDMYTIAVGSEYTGTLAFYVDGAKEPVVGEFLESETVSETNVVAMYLEKGKHTIKVVPKMENGQSVTFDYISILPGDEVGQTEHLELDTPVGSLNDVWKELYISNGGNDKTGDGSRQKPFATIKRAKDEIEEISPKMSGDIVVYIQPGEYKLEETEVFGIEHGGKNGYNVIFKSADIFEPALISGGKRVTGWKKGENGIWSAPLSGVEYVRNLYVNELPASRAKTKYTYRAEIFYGASGEAAGVTINAKNALKEIKNPDDMEMGWPWNWEAIYVPVNDYYLDGDKIKIECDPYAVARNKGNCNNTPAYFENAMEFLDEPGEFYWNRKEERIYYYPFNEEDMTTAVTYVGDTERMIKIKGESNTNRVQNLIFDNLRIMYGAWDFASRYGYMGKQGTAKSASTSHFNDIYDSQFAAQIEIENADRIVIKNCEIACHGSAGVDYTASVSNSQIYGCIVRDVSGTGICVGSPFHNVKVKGVDQCENIEINNNVVCRAGGEFYNNSPISVHYATNVDILHNYVKDATWAGMDIGWGWNTKQKWEGGGHDISYNRIENTVQMTRDTGAIYTLGDNLGTTISNNYFLNHDSWFDGPVLYHDSGSSNFEDFNNVFEDGAQYIGIPTDGYEYDGVYFHDNWVRDCNGIWQEGRLSDEKELERLKRDNVRIERATVVGSDEPWPEEAQNIIDNAGLEPAYARLAKAAEYPEWRPARHLYIPLKAELFKGTTSSWGIVLEAEDYMEGGEGVGYHKHKPAGWENTYRAETDVAFYGMNNIDTLILSTNAGGEWLRFKFEIEEPGYYYVDYIGSGIKNPDPLVQIHIDDVEITHDDEVTLPDDTATYDMQTKTLRDQVYLEKGTHILQATLRTAHFMDKIRLYTDEMKEDAARQKTTVENEAHYDEGVMGSYEAAFERLAQVAWTRADSKIAEKYYEIWRN